jgi:polysaccharide deacetylase 2 family uncharacterized protein YibQ
MQLIAMSDKFVGFVTKPTEIFSKNQSSMRPLISILQENNIELLYSNVRNFGVIENICRDLNADCLFPEFIVDEEVEGDNVYKALRKTQMEAEQKGKAIIYVNSYPQTLKALNRWLGELDVEKYVIVPPSTLLPKS